MRKNNSMKKMYLMLYIVLALLVSSFVYAESQSSYQSQEVLIQYALLEIGIDEYYVDVTDDVVQVDYVIPHIDNDHALLFQLQHIFSAVAVYSPQTTFSVIKVRLAAENEPILVASVATDFTTMLHEDYIDIETYWGFVDINDETLFDELVAQERFARGFFSLQNILILLVVLVAFFFFIKSYIKNKSFREKTNNAVQKIGKLGVSTLDTIQSSHKKSVEHAKIKKANKKVNNEIKESTHAHTATNQKETANSNSAQPEEKVGVLKKFICFFLNICPGLGLIFIKKYRTAGIIFCIFAIFLLLSGGFGVLIFLFLILCSMYLVIRA